MKILYLLVVLYLTFTSTISYASDNYCEALKYSLLFYKAQRAGRLPDNDIPWRGNTVLGDAYNNAKDSSGDGNLANGYFDAGDGVKFGFPQAYTMTMLSMIYLQYQNNIVKCGLDPLYLDVLKWGTDYIINAHVSDSVFVGQIAEGNTDHSFWGPPENITYTRQVYTISSSSPGTDLAMEAAAALASASIVFKTSNSDYSTTLLTHSKSLYNFAMTSNKALYSDSITDAAGFYVSSGYNDEIAWAGVWLYKATGTQSYLDDSKKYYQNNDVQYANQLSWDQKGVAVGLLLYQVTNTASYLTNVQNALKYWQKGGGITYTPGGLAYLSEWGPTRYAMGMSFIAMIVGGDYTSFGQSQLDYVLGKNPKSISYLVGWGTNFPKNPHHRAAHHSETFNINVPAQNTYTLYGSLVGGPSSDDSYADDRTNYIQSEVALDYNVGLVGTLAAVSGSSASASTTNPYGGTIATASGTNSNLNSVTQAPTQAPTTKSPTTQAPTTQAPTTQAPTTQAPTTQAPTTQAPTTQAPTTKSPTTQSPTTQSPTTQDPSTTQDPTTQNPSAAPSTPYSDPGNAPLSSDSTNSGSTESTTKPSTQPTTVPATTKPTSDPQSTPLPTANTNTNSNNDSGSGSISIKEISLTFSLTLLFIFVLFF